MEVKSAQEHQENLSELNKKIVEVKKKIQLSEGQRKALFEVCEAERKSNAEQILQLKKEISHLIVDLHETTSPTAKYRIQNKRIVEIIGPLADKSVAEVRELLDLQVIDNTKRLDLLRYRLKQRKKYFTELGSKYEIFLSNYEQQQLINKVEKPVKKSTSELQNAIHAVDVQIREAVHIRNRYLEIRRSLKDDADKFDSNVKKLEEDIAGQKVDIEKLQKIMDEATRMRNIARGHLLKEEKAVNSAANMREKEAEEGKRLVNERKIELERLERRIFQGGKMLPRPEPEGAEDAAPEEEKSPTPPHPVEMLAQAFEVLKQATGGTSSQEVLDKFKSQKDTEERLMLLRKRSEEDKHKLEKKTEVLRQKLDSYKYAEVKDAERKVGDMEKLQKLIDENQNRSRSCLEEKQKKDEALKIVLTGLQSLYLCINPLAITENDALVVLGHIEKELKEILNKVQEEEVETDVEGKVQVVDLELYDDKWLPAPYSGLIRRTPLPQPGTSPAPPAPTGSEDEEEVPSRGYLKRQAQLVIDAKSRRKNLRIQLPKRN